MAYQLSIAQDRRTKAQFTASNPVLLANQLAIETDSNVATTGDGTAAYLTIRGNTSLSGDDRRSADDVYAGQTLSDGRDEVGEGGGDPDGSFGFEMLFDTGTAGDPGAQSFNVNHATPASITLMRITVIDVDGESNAAALSLINPRRGDIQVTHADGTALFTINGTGALNGDFYEVPVDYVSGPLPANNAPCRVVYLPGGRTVGVYTGLLNQASTDAPVATFVTNDLGSVNFTYSDVGEYRLNSTGLFPAGTRVFFTGGAAPGFYNAVRETDNRIGIYVKDATAAGIDGNLTNASIRVEVPL